MSYHGKRIVYISPDRGTSMEKKKEEELIWSNYRESAARVGMDFMVINPNHITIGTNGIFLPGESLYPESDVIVYDIRPNSEHGKDLWTCVSLARSLEVLGFWLAIPINLSILFNDKYATFEFLKSGPMKVIPSVRMTSSRDYGSTGYERLIPDEWFPVFMKPASWGGGFGCVKCEDRATLDSVLGLASGTVGPILIQPWMPGVKSDVRVVVINGKIVAFYDRVPQGNSHVANLSKGGRFLEKEKIPDQVCKQVDFIFEKIKTPYFCLDFLECENGDIWFSEIELDGVVSGLFSKKDLAMDVVGRRFSAYSEALDGFLINSYESLDLYG